MQAQNAYLDARKKAGDVGDTRFPGATYGGGGTAILKPPPKAATVATLCVLQPLVRQLGKVNVRRVAVWAASKFSTRRAGA